jgi:hypothetical protein
LLTLLEAPLTNSAALSPMSLLPFALALVFVQAALPVRAQDDLPLPVFSEEVSVEWISVPTTLARDWPTKVPLRSEHFELSVDGARVAIESFDGWNAPFSLLFVQDLSGSMEVGGKLELGRRILDALCNHASAEDTIAVATFAGGQVDLQIPFTPHHDAVRASSSAWVGYGTTAVRDALAALPELALDAARPRRAVVMVTDGIDNASQLAVETVRSLLAGQGLPVYVIDVESDTSVRASPEQGSDEGLTLGDLAEASGGRRLQISSPAQVDAAARVIAGDLRRQARLSFTADTAGDSALRHIEVSVLGKTSGLIHRSRYYGPPPGHLLSPLRKEKP